MYEELLDSEKEIKKNCKRCGGTGTVRISQEGEVGACLECKTRIIQDGFTWIRADMVQGTCDVCGKSGCGGHTKKEIVDHYTGSTLPDSHVIKSINKKKISFAPSDMSHEIGTIEEINENIPELKKAIGLEIDELKGDAPIGDPCWYHHMKNIAEWLIGEFPWKDANDSVYAEITSDEFGFKEWIGMLIKKLFGYGLLPKVNENPLSMET